MGEHDDWFVGVADACVAFFTLVPAPVGVIVVVAGEVVDFLGGIALQTLGGGGAPNGEVECVFAVEAFFRREEVGETGVAAAVHKTELAAEAEAAKAQPFFIKPVA